MLQDATTGRPIRVFALPLISVALTVVYRIDKFGVGMGLAASAADAVAIWLGAVVANRLLDAVAERLALWARAAALTVALGVLGVLGVLAQRVLLPVQGGTTGTLILNIVITAFIGWALALLRATGNQLARTDMEIEKLRHELEWEIARANQTQWQQQRALARALHGPLQSAVNAAALRIDAAVRNGTVTPELVDGERVSIIDALGYLPTAAADRIPDLELDFRRIQGTWAGLCDITFEVSDGVLAKLAADPACSSAVTDIVTESCANAIRHGHATTIVVAIAQPDSHRLVTIVIVNDGATSDPASHSGLGTSLINDVALESRLEKTAGAHASPRRCRQPSVRRAEPIVPRPDRPATDNRSTGGLPQRCGHSGELCGSGRHGSGLRRNRSRDDRHRPAEDSAAEVGAGDQHQAMRSAGAEPRPLEGALGDGDAGGDLVRLGHLAGGADREGAADRHGGEGIERAVAAGAEAHVPRDHGGAPLGSQGRIARRDAGRLVGVPAERAHRRCGR